MSLFRYLGQKFTNRQQGLQDELELEKLKAQNQLAQNTSNRNLISSLFSEGVSLLGNKAAQDKAANEEEALLSARLAALQNNAAAMSPQKEFKSPTPPQYAELDPRSVDMPAEIMAARPITTMPDGTPQWEARVPNDVTPPEYQREPLVQPNLDPRGTLVPLPPIDQIASQATDEVKPETPESSVLPKSAADILKQNQPKPAEAPPEPKFYSKYGKTFDEMAKELNYDMSAFRDPKAMAKEIVAANKQEPNFASFISDLGNMIAGGVANAGAAVSGFGSNTNPKTPVTDKTFAGLDAQSQAERILEKRIALEIATQQAAAREKMIKEIKDQVKLTEQRNAGQSKMDKAGKFGAEAMKLRLMERDDKLLELSASKYGPMLQAAASEKDPAARAKALDLVVNKGLENGDMITTPELNSMQEIKGFIIQQAMEDGEKFLKNRKSAAAKADKPTLIADATVKELSQIKSGFENLTQSSASELSKINQVRKLVSDVNKTAGQVAADFKTILQTNPEAAAADATIKRNIAAYLKATSGLAATDAEFLRIWESAPNENDPPAVYYAKLNDFLEAMARQHNTTLAYMQDSGRDIGKLGPIEYVPIFSSSGEETSAKDKKTAEELRKKLRPSVQ